MTHDDIVEDEEDDDDARREVAEELLLREREELRCHRRGQRDLILPKCRLVFRLQKTLPILADVVPLLVVSAPIFGPTWNDSFFAKHMANPIQ